jgi:hypothetical protein
MDQVKKIYNDYALNLHFSMVHVCASQIYVISTNAHGINLTKFK